MLIDAEQTVNPLCNIFFTGIGTVTAMMLPYSVVLLVTWSLFLLMYWWLGIPLGLQAPYTYVAPAG
jgi:p-aminobenzoyl-glutamate transporter AbgT